MVEVFIWRKEWHRGFWATYPAWGWIPTGTVEEDGIVDYTVDRIHNVANDHRGYTFTSYTGN